MNSDHCSIVTFQEKIYKILKYITLCGFVPLLWFGSIFYFLSGDIIYGLIEISIGFIVLTTVLCAGSFNLSINYFGFLARTGLIWQIGK